MSNDDKSWVTGLGGVFFKANDPTATRDWYVTHLGIGALEDETVVFRWRSDDEPRRGHTVWAAFDRDSDYFGSNDEPLMLNYRVDDLDAALERLAGEGIEVLGKREDSEFARFGWIIDIDGRRVELCEPPEGS